MSDEDDKPLDGEVAGPGEGDDAKPVDQPPAKGKKGKASKGAVVTGSGFGRRQTEDERQQEEASSESFKRTIAFGLNWRIPGWEPSESDRHMVQMLKFAGYTDEQIAAGLGMSVETLVKHFDFELTNARMMIIGDLTTRAFTRARQGNDVVMMFLLKTRSDGAFSEKAQQMAALSEGLDKAEPNEKRRAELVGKILELLDTSKKKKQPKGEEKKS